MIDCERCAWSDKALHACYRVDHFGTAARFVAAVSKAGDVGVALKLRWLYKTPIPVQLAVLQGYNEQRALLGQPGCECLAVLDTGDGEPED